MLEKNLDTINRFQANNYVLAKNALQQLKDKVQLLTRKNKELRDVIKKEAAFKKSMVKTFHDLQSPLLSIDVAASNTNELPEAKRIALKSAMINVMDITNEALNQFFLRKKQAPENCSRQPVLLSAILSEIVEDRKLKYNNTKIEFEYKLNNLNTFLFIKISPSDFKRSISNLINNALDSLPEHIGTIKILVIDCIVISFIEVTGKDDLPNPEIMKFDNKEKRYKFKIGEVIEYFTVREYQIFKLLLCGFTAKQIAQKLLLSPRTVEAYITNIKFKLQCSSRYQITETAIRLGLINPQS